MITKKIYNSIINLIKRHAWSVWIGFIFGSLGLGISFQFFIYLIPLIILVEMSKNEYLRENLDRIKEETEEKNQKEKNLDFFK